MNADRELQTGVVVAAHGRRGQLRVSGQPARRYLVRGRQLRVVCGDRVNLQAEGSGEVIVTGIQERDNQLARATQDGRGAEVLAANLSLIAVVCAPVPTPDWFVVDRFICAAESIGAAAILIVNKSDLGTVDAEILDEYRQLGYPLLATNAMQASSTAKLAAVFAGHTGILVGQSGVGKTSLINALVPQADALTGRLILSSGEGRHTTSASLMYSLPNGGQLIDTPGVRDFVPDIDSAAALAAGFREIQSAGDNCRFNNCRHLREPGCAVKNGVETGEISARRYESYKRLLHSLAEKKL